MPNKVRNGNRLQYEKSPYLLQHAYNPVDWYPWNQEAFDKAQIENKPIMLSIGYSTCHWCHVMEKESFEDDDVAKLLNDNLICIKVDREERPDLDNFYMEICQMLTGSGGWPLNIFMTPDKKPFFAATYIPKDSRYNRMGLLQLVPLIKRLWTENHTEITSSAEEIIKVINNLKFQSSDDELNENLLSRAYEQLSLSYDSINGGFGGSPKFPLPGHLFFLLRYWKRTGNKEALNIVEKTLEEMRIGGIFDHIGFGFHRYAIDSQWQIPHFEKMLYDQALLSIVFTETFQITGNKLFSDTSKEILDYVLRNLTNEEGGFFSSEDADSEGEEGKFYLWTEKELQMVLSPDELNFVVKVFNVEPDGNFFEEAKGIKIGANILYIKDNKKELASKLGISLQEFDISLEKIRDKLFTIREKRIHPHKDDKILTDWNGLMIVALSRVAQVFNDPVYSKVAEKAVNFILNKLRTPSGELLHRYRDNDSSIPAFVDDYAFLIWGLLELYETTFNIDHLKLALELIDKQLELFWDQDKGGFYFTSKNSSELFLRRKEFYDSSIPSGNSVSMLNLLRIARITGNKDFEDKAYQIYRGVSNRIKEIPTAHTMLLAAIEFAVSSPFEIIITGNTYNNDTSEMIKVINRLFLPNKIVLNLPDNNREELESISGYTKNLSSTYQRSTAYICKNFTCKYPTNDIQMMLSLLTSQE